MRPAAISAALAVALAACAPAADSDGPTGTGFATRISADVIARSDGRIDFYLEDADNPCPCATWQAEPGICQRFSDPCECQERTLAVTACLEAELRRDGERVAVLHHDAEGLEYPKVRHGDLEEGAYTLRLGGCADPLEIAVPFEVLPAVTILYIGWRDDTFRHHWEADGPLAALAVASYDPFSGDRICHVEQESPLVRAATRYPEGNSSALLGSVLEGTFAAEGLEVRLWLARRAPLLRNDWSRVERDEDGRYDLGVGRANVTGTIDGAHFHLGGYGRASIDPDAPHPERTLVLAIGETSDAEDFLIVAGEAEDRWSLRHAGRRWIATAPPSDPIDDFPAMPFAGQLRHQLEPLSLSFRAEDDDTDVLEAELEVVWYGGPFVWPDP